MIARIAKALLTTLLILTLFPDVRGDVGFVKNQGQWDERITYSADIPMGVVYLEDQGITYLFWDKQKIEDIHEKTLSEGIMDYHALKLKLLGSNPNPTSSTYYPSEAYYNYYLDNDPNHWATGLHSYSRVIFHNVYPHIDLKIDGLASNFKYSFIVHPGGDPNQIQMIYEGAGDILLNQGSLIITTTLGDVIEEQPYTFQTFSSGEKEIDSKFILEGNLVSFHVSEYNKKKTLEIDPSVIFSSLSGSLQDNWGFTATYDEDGNGYSGGTVYGNFYPVTTGAFQTKFASFKEGFPQRDCGIYKLNSSGTKLLFATYYGGLSHEQPHSLVVSPEGNLLVLGTTLSQNLPMGANPVQGSNRGNWDVFVANFSSDGRKLNGATYLGGTGQDGVNGAYDNEAAGRYRNTTNLVWNYGDLFRGEIIAGKNNHVYIATTTESSGYPVSNNAYDRLYNGQQDAVISKLSRNLDTLIWSTFLGGTLDDAAYSIDLDEDENVYATGGTKGAGFPTSSSAYNKNFNGGMSDAFLVRISTDGTKLNYSTLIGTNDYDQAFFTKVGPDGHPWIYGQTNSNFPTKATSGNRSRGMFLTKFKKDLSDIELSRVFGANNEINISPSAFTVDLCGRVYLSGWGGLRPNTVTGNTSGLTTTPDGFDRTTDGRDFYMAVYTADLQTLIYATFFGGSGQSGEHVDGGTSRFDKRGVIYQAICAACQTGFNSTQFPTYPNNVYGALANHNDTTNCNNALVKIDLEGPALFAEFEHEEVVCQIPQQIDFTNHTQKATQFTWIMGDGTVYNDSNVSHTYTKPGVYEVKLIAFNPIACNLRDTLSKTLEIYAKAEADFDYDVDVCTKEVEFNHSGDYGKKFSWSFGDGSTSDDRNPVHRFTSEGSFLVKLTADGNTDCEDTFSTQIVLEDPAIDFDLSLDTCVKTVSLSNKSKGYESFVWEFGDGKASSALNPDHTYASRGSYDLTLRTNVGTDCEDTLGSTVDIVEIEADFELDIDTCTTAAVFTNNSQDADEFEWDFGFGSGSTEGNPVQIYPQGDKEYTVTLVAEPFSACADTAEITFRMPGLPEANFDEESDTCLSAAQFTNLLKDAPTWIWYFGNGDSSTVKDPYYNYRDTGDFVVTLIAYPYSDCPDTFSKLVDIDTFRFALFDLGLDTCRFEIQLTNQSEDLDSFSWHFDDGNRSNERNPKHSYGTDGDFAITLYGLKTSNGCEDSFTYDLYIPPLPVPGNEYLNDSCFNTYLFTDTSTYGSKSYWFASTGDSSKTSEFRVHFPEVGNYTVWQVSESRYGCLDTLEIPIKIDSIPTAGFDALLDSCIGAVITDDQSVGRFRSQWYFGNGSGGRLVTPVIDYEHEGTYTITLVINQGTECEDSIQKTVDIKEYQTERIFVPNVFTPNGDGYNDEFIIDYLRPDCDKYEIYIYNRWGVLVHQDEGQLDPWDGTTSDKILSKKNEPLQVGTYFYILKSDRVTLNGTITILR